MTETDASHRPPLSLPLLLAAVAVIVGAIAFRGRLLERFQGPRAVFASERQDLGSVPAGGSAEVRFTLRNAGGAPLRIVEVDGDCGCLTTDYPKSVAPGQTAAIVARFTANAAWSGRKERSLRVRTNDPAGKVTRLRLSANVVPIVQIEPGDTLEVNYRGGESVRREVRLIPQPGRGIRISKPAADAPHVTAQLDPPASADPGGAYRLRLEMRPPSTGDFRATVTCVTTALELPTLAINIIGRAETGPVVEPPEVWGWLQPGQPPGEEVGRFLVFTRSGKLRILKVVSDDRTLKAEILERNPEGATVRLLDAGGRGAGERRATVRVQTDDPRLPWISVPVRISAQ